jgi:hypothetical protein
MIRPFFCFLVNSSQVESGIDVLCTAYPQMLSQQGFAAVFPLCPFQSPVVVSVAGANEFGDGDGETHEHNASESTNAMFQILPVPFLPRHRRDEVESA